MTPQEFFEQKGYCALRAYLVIQGYSFEQAKQAADEIRWSVLLSRELTPMETELA